MNSFLLQRELGDLAPQAFQRLETTRLLHSLESTNIKFDGTSRASHAENNVVAHSAGVNSIAIDGHAGKYLVSGGADSSISLWNLEDRLESGSTVLVAYDTLRKTSKAHRLGITHVSWHNSEPGAVLASSYDHTLKLYHTEPLRPVTTIELDQVVYSHSMSPLERQRLVAIASHQQMVRLADLRTGFAIHGLPGHTGSVLSTAWSPKQEHILASSGTDGTVRLWDIRRASGCLGVLDMDDSLGVLGEDGLGSGARHRHVGRAHSEAANGVVWSEDGRHLVSTGHDERVRVWDVITGANTLVNFGPTIKNQSASQVLPLISPDIFTAPGKQLLFYPSDKEILIFQLFDGKLLRRLKTPHISTGTVGGSSRGRNLQNKTKSLAWRPHEMELYSAHTDGTIRFWAPRTIEDKLVEEEEREEAEHEEAVRKRKRDALEEIYQDFTSKRHMTYVE
ncbi:WD40-repeat-containing domain protein [Phyllosticta citrichinensis]|uniref:WD40-repeat-containing domain protein n=1 Tax=Phyllosticta citrichinensis TaxID=1130410 RepID=A0ABR1Y411_9PEZI